MPPNALCRLELAFELSHILSLGDVLLESGSWDLGLSLGRVTMLNSLLPPCPPPLSLSLHVGVYIDTNRLSRKPDLKLG